jgi:hypothetical protein
MVIARNTSDSLSNLLRRMDAALGQHRDCDSGSFVVFYPEKEAPGLIKELQAWAKREKLEKVDLGIYRDPGEGLERWRIGKFKIHDEADVTVVLYDGDGVVRSCHGFRKGEMDDKHIDMVADDLVKILTKKK